MIAQQLEERTLTLGMTFQGSPVSTSTKMTKLVEWLSVAVVVVGVWMWLLVTGLGEQWHHIIIPAPAVMVVLFGIYAASTVLYRVFTFNDCKEAAAELQQQIKEARADLTQKGLKFKQ